MGYVIAYFVIGLLIAFTTLVISHMPNDHSKVELEMISIACAIGFWPIVIFFMILILVGIQANKFSKTIAEKIIEHQNLRGQTEQEKLNLKQNPSYRDSAVEK